MMSIMDPCVLRISITLLRVASHLLAESRIATTFIISQLLVASWL